MSSMIKMRIRPLAQDKIPAGEKEKAEVPVTLVIKTTPKTKADKGAAAKEASLTYSRRMFVTIVGPGKEVPKGENILHQVEVADNGDKTFVLVGASKNLEEIIKACAAKGKKEGEGPNVFPPATGPKPTNQNQPEASFTKEKPGEFLKNLQAAWGGAGEQPKQDGQQPGKPLESDLVKLGAYQKLVSQIVEEEQGTRKRLEVTILQCCQATLEADHLMMDKACPNPSGCIIQCNINTRIAKQESAATELQNQLKKQNQSSPQHPTMLASQTTPDGKSGEANQSSPGPGVLAPKIEASLPEMVANPGKYYPHVPWNAGPLFIHLACANQPAGSSDLTATPLVEVSQEVEGYKGAGPMHRQGFGQAYLSGDKLKTVTDFKKLTSAVSIYLGGLLQNNAPAPHQGRFMMTSFTDSPEAVQADYGYPASWPAEGTEIRKMIDRVGTQFCRWLREEGGKTYKDHKPFQKFVKEMQMAWWYALPGAVYGGEIHTFPDTYRNIRKHLMAADELLCQLIVVEVQHREIAPRQSLETAMSGLPHREALQLLGNAFGTVLEAEAVVGAKTSVANVKVAVPGWGGAYCKLLRDGFRREKTQEAVTFSEPAEKESKRQKRGHHHGGDDGDGYSSASSGEDDREAQSAERRRLNKKTKEEKRRQRERDARRDRDRGQRAGKELGESDYLKCGWTKEQLTKVGPNDKVRVTRDAWEEGKNYPFRMATERVRQTGTGRKS